MEHVLLCHYCTLFCYFDETVRFCRLLWLFSSCGAIIGCYLPMTSFKLFKLLLLWFLAEIWFLSKRNKLEKGNMSHSRCCWATFSIYCSSMASESYTLATSKDYTSFTYFRFIDKWIISHGTNPQVFKKPLCQ